MPFGEWGFKSTILRILQSLETTNGWNIAQTFVKAGNKSRWSTTWSNVWDLLLHFSLTDRSTIRLHAFFVCKKRIQQRTWSIIHGEHFHCTWKSSISIVIIVILTMIMIITIFIFTATIIIIIITMMMKIKNPVLADERPTVVPLCSTGHKIPVTAFLLFSFFSPP